MARRLRQTSSRGSKKRSSPALPDDVITLVANTAALGEIPASAYSDGDGILTSPDVTSDDVYGENEADDGQAGDVVESRITGRIAVREYEQQVAGSEFSPPMDPADGDFVVAENFDEAGYLRLNPDVRRAIDIGQVASGYAHYLLYGRSEGRTLPDTPREARNILHAVARDAERSDVFQKEARCSIDALIIAPMGGLMIVGWIDDISQPLSCIRLLGPDWSVVMDASRFVRVRRIDVENAVGGRRSHAFGFIGFLHFDRGGDASGPMRVELWQSGGYSTAIQCAPAFVEDIELRDTMLAHLAGAAFFGNPCIESVSYLRHGVGAELVRFNLWITRRIVSAPYVERFGPQGRHPRGTIIVCLYGKPEFFFLQQLSILSACPASTTMSSFTSRIVRKWRRRCCAKRTRQASFMV
jgi:hypothetical protein